MSKGHATAAAAGQHALPHHPASPTHHCRRCCGYKTTQRHFLMSTMCSAILATIILPFILPLPNHSFVSMFFLPQKKNSQTLTTPNGSSGTAITANALADRSKEGGGGGGGGTRGGENAAQQQTNQQQTNQQQQQQQPQQAKQTPAVDDARAILHVLSYSVYGANPRYVEGMVSTAKLIPTVYGPDWTVRIYHDATVPVPILEELHALRHVQLVNVNQKFNPWVKDSCNPMSWRFLVAFDPTVKVYLIRDSDSRPSHREKAAVDEWLQSGKAFHVMRDHPLHHPSGFAAILGGMWGGRRRALGPDIESQMRLHYLGRKKAETSVYGEDQLFLWKFVLPLARNDVFQHDSYYCHETGGIAFPPTKHGGAGSGAAGRRSTFVGDAFINEDAYRSKRDHDDHDANNKRVKSRTYQCMARKEHRTKFGDCLARRHELLVNTVNGTAAETLDTSFLGLMERNSSYSQDMICPPIATVGKVNVGLRKNAGIRIKKMEVNLKDGRPVK